MSSPLPVPLPYLFFSVPLCPLWFIRFLFNMNFKNLSIKRRIVYTVEGFADRLFTPKYNPFYYLGTICAFLLVFIAISGLYLFFFYRTSSPYEAMQSITVNQWYLGGIMRSIHRYASDGLI